jgi:hypothetical protein
MTPAEIAQTKRMLATATRDYVHYAMKVRSYEQRNATPPHELVMRMQENDYTIKRLERDLIAAGVEVES